MIRRKIDDLVIIYGDLSNEIRWSTSDEKSFSKFLKKVNKEIQGIKVALIAENIHYQLYYNKCHVPEVKENYINRLVQEAFPNHKIVETDSSDSSAKVCILEPKTNSDLLFETMI